MDISKGTQTTGFIHKFKVKRPFAQNRVQMHQICGKFFQGNQEILCFFFFSFPLRITNFLEHYYRGKKRKKPKKQTLPAWQCYVNYDYIAFSLQRVQIFVLLPHLFSPNS